MLKIITELPLKKYLMLVHIKLNAPLNGKIYSINHKV